MIQIKKYWFKFSDGSIAKLEDTPYQWFYQPIQRYTSDMLGFGKWITYE